MKYTKILVSSITLITVSSCFTGIESTPRIEATGHDKIEKPSAEKLFVEVIKPEPPSQWQTGKQWIVTDDKISLIFSPNRMDSASIKGEKITYINRRNVATITGEDAVELTFSGPQDRTYTYTSSVSTSDFEVRKELLIPFSIELRPVEIADSLMRGNTYYIKSPRWYDSNGNVYHGLRHVAVTIDSVIPGNENHPLKVSFHQQGDSQEHYVMMTYGNSPSATRNFDVLFSFTNPRSEYPQIEDATWQLITRSEVAEGMTRDECRLALGTPSNISRGATHQAHIEHWSYSNGVYLIFEDGILTRFRK